jgi:hypothetical protein
MRLATSVKQPWPSKDQPSCALLQEAASVESPGYVLYRPIGENEIAGNHAALHTPTRCWKSFSRIYSNSTKVTLSSTITSPLPLKTFRTLSIKSDCKGAGSRKVTPLTKNEVRTDLQDRVVALEQDQEELQEHARVVQLHADIVDQA